MVIKYVNFYFDDIKSEQDKKNLLRSSMKLSVRNLLHFEKSLDEFHGTRLDQVKYCLICDDMLDKFRQEGDLCTESNDHHSHLKSMLVKYINTIDFEVFSIQRYDQLMPISKSIAK